MMASLRAALVSLLALTVITGLVYPALVTGVAQAALSKQANGSLVTTQDGRVVGSRWIGQSFDDPKYFWGRLSATTDASGKALPYNAGSSVASNYGPMNPALTDEVSGRIKALTEADPDNHDAVPVDLVTSSGSGLDPDISPAAAIYQIHRVAKARHMDDAAVRALVDSHVEERELGVLGERRVNVLALNLALDERR